MYQNQIKTARGTMLVTPKASPVDIALDEYCLDRDLRLLHEPEIVDANDASYAELHLGLVEG